MYLPVLISAISVQEVPLYCSTKLAAGLGTLAPAIKPESADVPNPVPPYLPVFKAPPDDQVPTNKFGSLSSVCTVTPFIS